MPAGKTDFRNRVEHRELPPNNEVDDRPNVNEVHEVHEVDPGGSGIGDVDHIDDRPVNRLPEGDGNVGDTRPNNATSSTANAMLGASLPKVPIIHNKKPTVYDGDFRPTAEALRNVYKLGGEDVPEDELFDRFGRTEVVHGGLPDNLRPTSFKVYNNQFDLGNGKRGVRVLPVSDDNGGDNASNIATEAAIREMQGVSEGHLAPYEIIFTHPETDGPDGEGLWNEFPGEGRKGTLATVAGPGGGVQGHATHRGAGIGFHGKTHNSPETYHQRQFHAKGYPPVALAVHAAAVNPDVEASQKVNSSLLLNDGVNFSNRPYKNDFVRIIDVNTTLMFARDWAIHRGLERGIIDRDNPPQALKDLHGENLEAYLDYLGSDEWTTYCAEHRGSVDYHWASIDWSEAGFQEVYGDDLGALLFDVSGQIVKQAAEEQGLPMRGGDWPGGVGPESLPDPETGERFTPVWKTLGKTAEDVKPFKSPKEYDAYHEARRAGPEALEAYKANGGTIPLAPGEALPYAPQTNADLVKSFMEKFHPWMEVGGFQAGAAVVAFMDKVTERHGIDKEAYLQMALPIVVKMVVAEALAQGATDRFFATAGELMKQTLNKLVPENAPEAQRQAAQAAFGQIAAKVDEALQAQKPQLQATIQQKFAGQPMPRTLAHAQMLKMLQPDIEKARALPVGDRDEFVENNIPPALLMDAAQGLHKTGEGFTIQYLGTLMDSTEVQEA